MMSRRKGTEPETYAGVFQRYEDIPERYRLETYRTQYGGRDIWEQYVNNILLTGKGADSRELRRTARIAGSSWQEHMQERECHHALATPADVNCWCQHLREGNRTRRTCYDHYFMRIYQFYDYLKFSCRHPHLYNPLLLAAIEYDSARWVWMQRIEARPEVIPRE